MKKKKLNIDERYISKLENHLENAQSSAKYSSDRFDVLIITISTSALIITVGFVKNLIGDSVAIDTGILKISWLFLVVSIISNLLSQQTAYFAHEYDMKITRNLIRIERQKEPKGDQLKFEGWCSKLNTATKILNISSLGALIIGIITIVIFYSKNI